MSKLVDHKVSSTKRARTTPRGFVVLIDVLPGLPLSVCRQIERCLEDHAEVHGLVLEGHQLRRLVMAHQHDLSITDQVVLIDRMLEEPGVIAVRVGAIRDHDHAWDAQSAAPAAEAYVVVRTADIVTVCLTLLYRGGRINAAQYLQIHGGYVRSADLH